MSMLAERKIRQKWCLNPRGKDWSEDSNKFGQKMLEKMGWSKGKGLGAKENGIVDHLKISFKNDSKGMGFKETNNQWTEHDTNFSALLESLSGEKVQPTEVQISSLEKKSQSSKVRVHYKKFTRGKDLSRCSEKDLACIFGKKSLKEAPVKPKEEEIEESKSNSFILNGGSMVDYFKKKLPNYGKGSGYVVGSNGVLKKESDSEEEPRGGFGFGGEKKRKYDEEETGTPKKIKKEEDQKGVSNPAFDPLFGNVDVKKQILNTIDEEESEVGTKDASKKKKKKKSETNLDENKETENAPIEVERKSKKEDSFEKKNKKKKSKDTLALDNPNFDGDSQEYENGHTNDNFEVKRKKKKEQIPTAIDNPNFDIHSDENGQSSFSNDNFEVKRKKKKKQDVNTSEIAQNDFEVKRKKKKKSEDDSLALDNPIFNISDQCQDSYVDGNFEVKRKKKKKKSEDDSLALDNPIYDDSNTDCQNSYVDSNFEVKRKKKKSPNFEDKLDDSQISQKQNDVSVASAEPALDLILNVTSTPSVPKAAAPSKQSSTKKRKNVRFSDVNEERIIPNKEDVENRNELFDINSQVIANGLKNTNLDLDGNIDEISKKIDGFQAEIENDINEAKVSRFVGEVGGPEGGNEKLPNGTKLKFKFAKFGRSPNYSNKSASRARTSYKHLIKGDITLAFRNTNLHEIVGYGVKTKNKVS